MEGYFHTAFFFFTFVVPSYTHTHKKAFHNRFASVLLDSAYSKTLSAEPNPFPQDDRNLLYNSASNSGTYCGFSSVSQTRIYFTETTTALKTGCSQHPNKGICLQLPSLLWSLHHFPPSSSSFRPSFQSTFPCAGGNPFPLLPVVRAASHTLHNMDRTCQTASTCLC